jgi:hypothetical protein
MPIASFRCDTEFDPPLGAADLTNRPPVDLCIHGLVLMRLD